MVLEEAPLDVRLILLCIKFKEGPGLRSEETAVLLTVGLKLQTDSCERELLLPKVPREEHPQGTPEGGDALWWLLFIKKGVLAPDSLHCAAGKEQRAMRTDRVAGR